MDGNEFLYKIVVVSDSHHDIDSLQKIIPVINSADYFVYCGDGVADIMAVRGSILVPIICVRGNNDFDTKITDVATVSFGATRALITHGHRFDVRNGLKPLYVLAQQEHCRLVFFGHTHRYIEKKVQDVLFVNPGALCNGSYALVAGDGKEFKSKQMLLTE